MDIQTNDLMVSTTGAARLANRSAETIRAWADTGVLPHSRTETGWRLFRPADVLRVAKARERARR